MDDILGYESRREGDELTVRVRGDFSAPVAERFVEACQRLSPDITRMRIDLTGVERLDETSVSALRAFVDWWRHERDGGVWLQFTTARVMAAYREAAIPGWRPMGVDR